MWASLDKTVDLQGSLSGKLPEWATFSSRYHLDFQVLLFSCLLGIQWVEGLTIQFKVSLLHGF